MFGDPAHAVGVSPDGGSVYVTSYGGYDPWSPVTLHRVDVTGETLGSAASFGWDWQSRGRAFEFGSDGRVYVVINSTVAVLDGRTMERVSRYDLDLQSGWNPIAGLAVAGGKLYVSHAVYQPGWSDGGAVKEYDLRSGRRLRTWDFAVQAGQVRAAEGGRLYVDSWDRGRDEFTTWIVPL